MKEGGKPRLYVDQVGDKIDLDRKKSRCSDLSEADKCLYTSFSLVLQLRVSFDLLNNLPPVFSIFIFPPHRSFADVYFCSMHPVCIHDHSCKHRRFNFIRKLAVLNYSKKSV
jgi:hypothetical protein